MTTQAKISHLIKAPFKVSPKFFMTIFRAPATIVAVTFQIRNVKRRVSGALMCSPIRVPTINVTRPMVAVE